jgi:hypothetical protein
MSLQTMLVRRYYYMFILLNNKLIKGKVVPVLTKQALRQEGV